MTYVARQSPGKLPGMPGAAAARMGFSAAPARDAVNRNWRRPRATTVLFSLRTAILFLLFSFYCYIS
jgi:hypothetical protein